MDDKVIQLIMVGDVLHGLTELGRLVRIRWNAHKERYDVDIQSDLNITI